MVWLRFTLVNVEVKYFTVYFMLDYFQTNYHCFRYLQVTHVAKMRAELNHRLEQWNILVESSNIRTTRRKQLQSLLDVISQSMYLGRPFF